MSEVITQQVLNLQPEYQEKFIKDLLANLYRTEQRQAVDPETGELKFEVDPETGEVFGNPTQNQLRQAAKNFRARNMTSAARRVEAAMEEKTIQSGRTQAGETSVGPRKGGERGQRVRGEETQVKNMITGTRRDGVTNLRPENEDTLKSRLNKGGKVTKKAIGAHDYRMNKGGLLLSSVDNRKKK